MKAMVLAAGFGTRLRPLTDDRPKALVEVGGRTLLEITLKRLQSFGVQEAIVNVHHFADLVVSYLDTHHFGMRIAVSREEVLLDTGGGLKNAAWFFEQDGANEPFLLHNVDVLSTIDFTRMVQEHRESGALATLAVAQRESSRQLLFDQQGQLCGRRKREAKDQLVRPAKLLAPQAFAGIHVISPEFLQLLEEQGAFSIIDSYLRLAGSGAAIRSFAADRYYWRDLGRLENIRQAEQDIKEGLV
jgi:NDP-sugar pyrophosphorylase family protein